MSKKKGREEDMPSDIIDESAPASQTGKLSRKEKFIKLIFSKPSLLKILLTTETSKESKHLRPSLRPIKRKLAENFSLSDKSFQGDDLNELLWIYLNEGTDITIKDEQKKHLPEYKAKITLAPPSEFKEMPLHHYIALLNSIIKTLFLFFECDIKPLIEKAKKLALQDNPRQEGDVYTVGERELQYAYVHGSAKQHFDGLMEEKLEYDQDRFDKQCAQISGTFAQNSYKELMVFALLGFHYFDKKNDVYAAFTPECLESQISFDLPDYPEESSYTLSVKEFLQIMEQLNFKKNLFDLHSKNIFFLSKKNKEKLSRKPKKKS
ncbi:MAG: hypothetical protein WC875_02645 [Candidatus Absconditabacterales bacterium]